jgi:hypothetical protein
MTTNPLSLAEKCEAETGPYLSLMTEAYKATFPEVSAGAWDAIDDWAEREEHFCTLLQVGAHLDAAMMFLPEGWTWDVDATAPEMGIDWTLWAPTKDGPLAKGTSKFPALALVAASLRARASAHGEG